MASAQDSADTRSNVPLAPKIGLQDSVVLCRAGVFLRGSTSADIRRALRALSYLLLAFAGGNMRLIRFLFDVIGPPRGELNVLDPSVLAPSAEVGIYHEIQRVQPPGIRIMREIDALIESKESELTSTLPAHSPIPLADFFQGAGRLDTQQRVRQVRLPARQLDRALARISSASGDDARYERHERVACIDSRKYH